MGADLILAAAFYPAGRTLDWDAGRHAIDVLSDDRCAEAVDSLIGDRLDDQPPSETARLVRQRLHEAIGNLSESPRDLTTIDVPGYSILVTGGMSWGDSPTESFDDLEAIGWTPEVMRAIGFEVEGS